MSEIDINAEAVEQSAKFCEAAARHFTDLPTDGEDMRVWANTYNAENATRAAVMLRAQAERIAELEGALRKAREEYHLYGGQTEETAALMDAALEPRS